MVESGIAPLDIVAKNQLNVLIQLALADKHIAEEERQMIFRVGREKNFPDEEVMRLLQNPETIGTLGALSNSQKLNYLLSCIDMILIDQKIFERELNFCRSIAIKMNLRMSVIDFLIENRYVLTPEELLGRIFTEFMA